MKQCARLLQSTPRSGEKDDLRSLQGRLESKIRIVSPAIDMIELIAARGNTSLESAVQLTKEIRWEIQALGLRLADAANEEELFRRRSHRGRSREQIALEIGLITADMRRLLTRIEDAVPLINLAITTSGVNLTTNLPATVSPSRLLQASTLLTAADARYGETCGSRVQVGPTYVLSIYMLFAGHAWRPQDREGIRATTWKEVIHKAKVKLVRLPIEQLYDLPGREVKSADNSSSAGCKIIPGDDAAAEYSYQLLFIEDFDDDRMHTFDVSDKQPGPCEDIPNAGIRDVLPIHQISKIFYADTGKMLNIGSDGETNSPVLLLKRDIYAEPPRRMMERQGSASSGTAEGVTEDGEASSSDSEDQFRIEAQIRRESAVIGTSDEHDEPSENVAAHSSAGNPDWGLPPDLDPEWIALEVYTEASDSEDDDEDDTDVTQTGEERSGPASRRGSVGLKITKSLSDLKLNDSPGTPRSEVRPPKGALQASQSTIKTSLSLLEMLIRLTALQQFRQASHLTVEDELLNFFLADSSTTGAGPNAEYRQRVRRDARSRLGFDPYDESPLKRRGEEYIAHPNTSPGRFSYHESISRADGRSPSLLGSTNGSAFPSYTFRDQAPPSPLMSQSRPRLSSARSSPGPTTPAPDTPMSTHESKSRRTALRAQSEKPASPSPLRYHSQRTKRDSTLAASPSSADANRSSAAKD
ncbi:Ran-binding-domain-containing protein [Myriangium duriaei CBS 260.36]|uniref:Ran-binding-domain-containing protein n=1 Tax=Myriangium duriaei CBS 260.36 TaxID=1168546 RepID=A0A9P4IYT5_9PEZI|nr:Ran-binding-domain-containing protein [Myriangium duriaei CBS 260.36]